MRFLFILLLSGGLVILPFAFLKQSWAVRLWHRVRLIILIYTAIILASAIVRLVLHWDDFYG